MHKLRCEQAVQTPSSKTSISMIERSVSFVFLENEQLIILRDITRHFVCHLILASKPIYDNKNER